MLSWLKTLAPSGAGGVPTVLVPPGTPIRVAPGCGASPCCICQLRSTIEKSLLRHPNYREVLQKEIEEREQKLRARREALEKRAKGRSGKSPSPPPPAPEEPPRPGPLELFLVGLRREGSLSNSFDDRMVVFCRLPTAAEAAQIEAAAGSLLAPLKEAAQEIPEAIRVVTCSAGSWLVALLTISTDPGLKKTAAEIDAAIAAARQRAEKSGKAQDQKAWEAAEHAKAQQDQEGALVDGGWLHEGRGMMLPGYFPEAYTFRIHHGSGEHFASDTSLTALTTGGVPALRVYSGWNLRANGQKFVAPRQRVQELRSQATTRHFESAEAFLIARPAAPAPSAASGETAKTGDHGRKKTKPAPVQWVIEVQIPSTHETLAVQDTDVLFLYGTAAGTNLHRAHQVELPEGAQRLRGGAASSSVYNWSEGCQVFPDWKEFNFFITLCALAKRWKCACGYHVKPDHPGCAVLEAGESEELGAGEQALVKAFGQRLLDQCADANRLRREGKKEGIVTETTDTIRQLTWTEENQKQLAELEAQEAALKGKGGKLDPASSQRLKRLRSKKTSKLTPEEEERLNSAYKVRDQWRREYLREKTKRLAADHLRLCDVNWSCKARFSYALVEMSSEEIAAVEKSFTNATNRKWNGKLT